MPGLVMFGCAASMRIFARPKSTTLTKSPPVRIGSRMMFSGFEIAMDDAEVVRFGERREHLPEHVDDAAERERPFLVLDAREVLAAQELHDEVELAVLRLAEVDDADGVRVIEPARRARLGDEARRRVLFADEVRVDDLDRDRAPEVRLLGAVDAAHPADADEIEDHVAARQRAADERIVGLHRDLRDGKAARRTELVRLFARALALRTLPHPLAPGSEAITLITPRKR